MLCKITCGCKTSSAGMSAEAVRQASQGKLHLSQIALTSGTERSEAGGWPKPELASQPRAGSSPVKAPCRSLPFHPTQHDFAQPPRACPRQHSQPRGSRWSARWRASPPRLRNLCPASPPTSQTRSPPFLEHGLQQSKVRVLFSRCT